MTIHQDRSKILAIKKILYGEESDAIFMLISEIRGLNGKLNYLLGSMSVVIALLIANATIGR